MDRFDIAEETVSMIAMTRRICAAVAMVLTAVFSSGLAAATIQVTRADDPVPGTCLPSDCSLREAAMATVATPEADVVMLQAGQYLLSRC